MASYQGCLSSQETRKREEKWSTFVEICMAQGVATPEAWKKFPVEICPSDSPACLSDSQADRFQQLQTLKLVSAVWIDESSWGKGRALSRYSRCKVLLLLKPRGGYHWIMIRARIMSAEIFAVLRYPRCKAEQRSTTERNQCIRISWFKVARCFRADSCCKNQSKSCNLSEQRPFQQLSFEIFT